MNPTLEVQITARLDKLDAALKIAESKVSQSAATMGTTGEKGGSMFVDKMVGNMAKGLAMGAITTVLGNGILTALQGINAGKSGEEIGAEIGKGIVDGAKSIPIVGTVVAILDEIINGLDRVTEAAHDRAADIANAFRDAFHLVAKSSEDMAKTVTRKTEDMAAKSDPKQQANLNAQRLVEDANASLKKIEDEKQMLRDAASAAEAAKVKAAQADRKLNSIHTMESGADRAINQKEVDDALAKSIAQAASERLAQEEHINKLSIDLVKALNEQKIQAEKSLQEDYDKINAEAAAKDAKADADKKTAADKALAEKKKADDALIELAKKQDKAKVEAAIQAQQDIIDGEKQAQEQIDKIGRVDQMAAQAAQGMIGSGQTALGQFNFAQSGAGNQAITLAQKQVTSLEKIEAATAMQVQLQKEMRGFN
jgi:hypothetical protein